ncbi:hypothetical protein MP228_008032 [Amoeboaphelidium protococcarum]|nr:hypothetical protein MP228_008032 [Amoeboaphelidium protococcarum]
MDTQYHSCQQHFSPIDSDQNNIISSVYSQHPQYSPYNNNLQSMNGADSFNTGPSVKGASGGIDAGNILFGSQNTNHSHNQSSFSSNSSTSGTQNALDKSRVSKIWNSPFSMPSLNVSLFSPTSSAPTPQQHHQSSFLEPGNNYGGGMNYYDNLTDTSRMPSDQASYSVGPSKIDYNTSTLLGGDSTSMNGNANTNIQPVCNNMGLFSESTSQFESTVLSHQNSHSNDILGKLRKQESDLKARIQSRQEYINKMKNELWSDEMELAEITRRIELFKSQSLGFGGISSAQMPESFPLSKGQPVLQEHQQNSSSGGDTVSASNDISQFDALAQVFSPPSHNQSGSVAAATVAQDQNHAMKANDLKVSASPQKSMSQTKNSSAAAYNQDNVCRKWNRGICMKGSHCSYLHQCLSCGEQHMKSKCPRLKISSSNGNLSRHMTTLSVKEDNAESVDVSHDLESSQVHGISNKHRLSSNAKSIVKDEPCIKWNYAECQWGDRCHRHHVCIKCSGSHRLLQCPSQSDGERRGDTRNTSVVSSDANGNIGGRSESRQVHLSAQSSSLDAVQGDADEPQSAAVNTSPLSDNTTPILTQSSSPVRFNGKISEVCFNFNDNRCKMGKKCHRLHVCSACKADDHVSSTCPKKKVQSSVCQRSDDGESRMEQLHNHQNLNQNRSSLRYNGSKVNRISDEVCLNWNNNRCPLPINKCKRVHVCSFCKSPSHNILKCMDPTSVEHYVDAGVEICYNHNHLRCDQRNCTLPMLGSGNGSSSSKSDAQSTSPHQADGKSSTILIGQHCKRLHCCSNCKSFEHTAKTCPQASPPPPSASQSL